MKKTTACITTGMITALLTACGGGGSGTPSTSGSSDNTTSNSSNNATTGQVIDGYLVGATVFLDKNLNGKLDSGEPNTKTTAGGEYTLNLTPVESKNYPIIALINENTQDTGSDELATTGEAASANGNYILSTPPGQRIITPFTTPILGTLKRNGRILNIDLSKEENSTLIAKLVTSTSESIEKKIPNSIRKVENGNFKKFPLFENFLKSDSANKEKTQDLAEKITVVMAKVTDNAISKEARIKSAGDAETAVFNALTAKNMLPALANDNVSKSSIAAAKNTKELEKAISDASGTTVSISVEPETNSDVIPAKQLTNAFAVYKEKNGIHSFNVSTDNSERSDKATMKFTLCPVTSAVDESNVVTDVFLGCYNSNANLEKQHKKIDGQKDGLLDEQGRSIYYSKSDSKTSIEQKGENIIITKIIPFKNSNEEVISRKVEIEMIEKNYSKKPVKQLLQDILIADSKGEEHYKEARLFAGIKKQIDKLPGNDLPNNSLAYSVSKLVILKDVYEIDGSVKKDAITKNESEFFTTLDELNNVKFHLGGNYAEIDMQNKKIIWHKTEVDKSGKLITGKVNVDYTEKLRGNTKLISFQNSELKYEYFIAEGRSENTPRLIYGSYDPAGDKTPEVSSELSFNKAAYDAIHALLKKAASNGEIDLLKTFSY